MKNSKWSAIVCLVAALALLPACDDSSGGIVQDSTQLIEDQLVQALPAITALLQNLNPFNAPAPPSARLGTLPPCPDPKEGPLCPDGGEANCGPVGDDFQYEFIECATIIDGVIPIGVVVNGVMTYLDSAGAGGWPDGDRVINFDGGQILGSFTYDIDLTGTADAVIFSTSLTGAMATCCVNFDDETAECFAEGGVEVCDPVKEPS